MSKRKSIDNSNDNNNNNNDAAILSNGPISFTTRNPPWAYLHLELISNPSPTTTTTTTTTAPIPLDPLTARTHLTSALTQFLGLTGSSIAIDILKLEAAQQQQQQPQPSGAGKTNTNTHTNTVWVRVPYSDTTAVIAALSSWVGEAGSGSGSGGVAWRVKRRGGWLGSIAAGGGGEMFVP